jgi:hypothetical protein
MNRIARARTTFLIAIAFVGCGSSENPNSKQSNNAQPQCVAPDCACSTCFDACMCQTGNANNCAAVCGAPGSGGAGPGGTGGFGTGGFATGGFGTGGFATGGFGTGGVGTGGVGTGGVGTGGGVSGGCGQTLPPISDYGARGPFATTTVNNTGPNGAYTMFRPTTLGENGFLHPPTTWGNGITTTPATYPELLGTIASHGFVIIASNSTNVTGTLMTQGLDWLIQQNSASGDFQGKLATSCAVSIGYSLGGGAAVDTGKHPSVVTTVSFHGLQGTAEQLHGPLLLFTSTGDTFVSAAQFVTPTYNRSTVQTFYATLTGGSHLTPIGNAGDERAPAVAWLRLWVYGDQEARKYFYGDSCICCVSPFTNPQRKNWQ